MTNCYKLIRPILFLLPPETAHKLTLMTLRLAPSSSLYSKIDQNTSSLKQHIWDRTFPNPVGIAAGFDKNAEALTPLFNMGFGFIEAGTVTPKMQIGNPKPRIFRCPEQRALINRMGFPNDGMAAFKTNLEKFFARKPRPSGVLGINIGMNKDQTNPIKDYTQLIRILGPMADYITINISSPNTPGLRNLQEKAPLTDLLTAIIAEREKSCTASKPPILVKLAPDVKEEQLVDIAEVLLTLKIDGVILTNTTLERPEILPKSFAQKQGGLSGALLTQKSTEMIRRFYSLTKGQIPIIGVGGICNAEDAYAKIRAGASLIQIYTGLVYEGPRLVDKIKTGLMEMMKRDGFTNISQVIGIDHKDQNQLGKKEHENVGEQGEKRDEKSA